MKVIGIKADTYESGQWVLETLQTAVKKKRVALDDIASGASCETCESPISGQPVAAALTVPIMVLGAILGDFYDLPGNCRHADKSIGICCQRWCRGRRGLVSSLCIEDGAG